MCEMYLVTGYLLLLLLLLLSIRRKWPSLRFAVGSQLLHSFIYCGWHRKTSAGSLFLIFFTK